MRKRDAKAASKEDKKVLKVDKASLKRSESKADAKRGDSKAVTKAALKTVS